MAFGVISAVPLEHHIRRILAHQSRIDAHGGYLRGFGVGVIQGVPRGYDGKIGGNMLVQFSKKMNDSVCQYIIMNKKGRRRRGLIYYLL